MTTTGRATALLDVHRALGGRLVDFAGWEMPIQYSGVVAEHRAVREEVGVFDVSHLGKLHLAGADAVRPLQHALTADVAALDVGRATYSLALTDEGGCVDDLFVYRLAEQEWLVVPNAANVAAVGASITDSGGDPQDEWARWSIIAIQGPRAGDLFERAFPGSSAGDLPLHSWTTVDVLGEKGLAARTGYTGERGFELYAPTTTSPAAFERLVDLGGTPAGLGARDTLRLEMGFALYGQELSRDINPLEAALGWAIAWDTDFRGRDALAEVRATGPARRVFGIRCTGRGIPRAGCDIELDGSSIGRVTSGNFSPTLGTGIALALGPAATRPAPGAVVDVVTRGRRIEGAIVKPPFVKKGQ